MLKCRRHRNIYEIMFLLEISILKITITNEGNDTDLKLRKFMKRCTAALLTAVMAVTLVPGISARTEVAEASANDPIVVVLDPGHGGSDPGACNDALKTNEARSNWAIAVACKEYLEKYENVVVYMTKTQNSYSTLSQRVNFVVSKNADLCVSLHNNSAGTTISTPRGCEVYRSIVEPFASNTAQLAQDVCNNLSALGLPSRGVKTRRSTLPETPDDDYFTLIAGPISEGIPSILIEHAFVSNYHDSLLLNNANSLKQMGQADAKAIAKYFNLKLKGAASTGTPTLETTTYMQSYGWIATQPNGMIAGFPQYRTGDHRDKRMEAFKINVNNEGVSGNISYQPYVNGYGWMPHVSNGATAGTSGQGRMLEGIRVNLTGDLAAKYDIYYRVNSGTAGWMGWAKNGEVAGKIGYDSKIRAMQVKLVTKGGAAPGPTGNASEILSTAPSDAKIVYHTHVQTYGWESNEIYDGKTSGTTGQSKRLEAIKIRNNTKISGSIKYQVHCQSYGWMNWESDGTLAGTSGEGKRLEAIRIKLEGELKEKYDVYYRVHAQSYGWLDWAKNGQASGTSSYAKRLEAIEIKLVPKGGEAPGSTERPYVSPMVSYKTHVQTYGWQSDVTDGQESGTSGQAKRLEAITINNMTDVSGSIRYRVHCQSYGWMNWASNGAMAGTSGQAKRLEAIRIELQGELKEKYDVYYRVHSQTYGWLDWAKNGESAGTAGLAKRLEAIQIVYVPKGGAAPGATTNPFIDGTINTTPNTVESIGDLPDTVESSGELPDAVESSDESTDNIQE